MSVQPERATQVDSLVRSIERVLGQLVAKMAFFQKVLGELLRLSHVNGHLDHMFDAVAVFRKRRG